MPSISSPVTAKTPTTDLLTLAYQGEQVAFDQLYTQHHRQILLYLYRMVRDHHTAEDLMQDTFLLAFKNIRGGERPRRFIPWLYRVARNLALNANLAATIRYAGERELRRSMKGSVTQENGKWSLSSNVLRGLSPTQQEIVTRYYVHDEDMPAIGQALDLHRNTVSVYLAQAQDVLRRRRVEGDLL
jgi:RNA polymerase sigma-70 factor (ECF subfamily)